MPDSLNIVPVVKDTTVRVDRDTAMPTPIFAPKVEKDSTATDSLSVATIPVLVMLAPKKVIYKRTLSDSICTPGGVQNTLFYRPELSITYNDSISNKPVEPSAIYGLASVKSYTVSENLEKAAPQTNLNYSLIAIAIFAFYALIKAFSKSFGDNALKSAIFYKQANTQFESRYNKENKFRNLYHLFYIIILSVFISILLNNNSPEFNFLSYLSVICLLLGVSLLQFGSLNLSGNITKSDVLTRRLNYERQTIYGVVSLFLLPICILLLLYGDTNAFVYLVYTGIFLILIPVFFIIIRSFISFFKTQISYFFWILYLCTFEILPYCLVYLIIMEKV